MHYLFADTLPLQVSGLVTVLRDTCPEVVYKGEEDLHDPAFDYLAVPVLLTEQEKMCLSTADILWTSIHRQSSKMFPIRTTYGFIQAL
jgi:hypothetical protein